MIRFDRGMARCWHVSTRSAATASFYRRKAGFPPALSRPAARAAKIDDAVRQRPRAGSVRVSIPANRRAKAKRRLAIARPPDCVAPMENDDGIPTVGQFGTDDLGADAGNDDLRRPGRLRQGRRGLARRSASADRPRRRRRRQSDRHRRHLFGRACRGNSRRGDGRQAPARHADRLQGALHHGPGPQRQGPVALAPDPRLRSEPQAAAHRRHRPLSGPPMGRPDAARGDARGARQPRARGQGALRRLLQLLRLARDEGAGDRAPRRPHPLRVAADPLHACRRARPSTS